MSRSIRSFFTPVSNSETPEPLSKKARVSESVDVQTGISETSSTDVVSSQSFASKTFGWPPFDNLSPGWKARLAGEYDKPYFQSLLRFLDAESKSGKVIFPPSRNLFTALNLCPFEKTKVVIIGQDPYHGPGQAHGLAFSVQRGFLPLPPSLKNIISELKSDPAVAASGLDGKLGDLECWSQQGVLLLNTVLTVRKAEANSHQKRGWEDFTDAVVRELGKKQGVVYLLWGKPAQAKCKDIDATKNSIITSSHPSPLAAYKTSEPFMGSRCFSRCNEALTKMGLEPIDWSIK